ncbi:hypothetical protein DINM_001279 [Dirofilaria immitis]|nr:hypothetical protein [Dirofilaria immitis]
MLFLFRCRIDSRRISLNNSSEGNSTQQESLFEDQEIAVVKREKNDLRGMIHLIVFPQQLPSDHRAEGYIRKKRLWSKFEEQFGDDDSTTTTPRLSESGYRRQLVI